MLLKTIKELKPNKWNHGVYGSETLDEAFIESIRNNGIREPLVIKNDGVIISGHKRYHAAIEIGLAEVPVRFEEYNSEVEEREAFIDYNRYREKTFSQLMSEAEFIEETERIKSKERQLAQLKRGGEKQTPVREIFPERETGRTRDKVASQIGIGSGKHYEKAKKIWQEAKSGNETAKKLVGNIDKGRITIHSAYKSINQKEEISLPPLPQGRYEIILADPPWRYEFSETSMRAIENQYPTMDLEQIKELDIPAADDSVLFLWATAPKLEEALQVLNAWGFTYKTCAVWDKEKKGMGYWFRGQHELLLVGVKGKPKTPDPASRFPSVIQEKRTEHSSKPQVLYPMIEKMFPGKKYVELFARKNRQGWDSWGNEV